MTSPPGEFFIVGRVRRAHGIRGELAVEIITDAPDAVFAPGARVFAGTTTGDLVPERSELHVVRATPFKGGMIVTFREISDRTEAERWRDRYFLVPAAELPPRDEHEVYVHELIDMRVVLSSGEEVGRVIDVYELPQGLALDVQRANGNGTVMLPFSERVVTGVDREARVITVDPPEGMLD
ncbi:MAG: ribosome maturation factor RimM [Gemmatimonadota bacterium]|nr:ribosome maturation factor RimM [Gemmatimonadota bacterium]